MIRKIIFVFICLFNYTVFACSNAAPTDDASFCTSFKAAATCYCISSGLPNGMCQDMNTLYNRMMVVFGSLQKACNYQHYTTQQDCVDNWKCFQFGGIDSRGRLCNATQQACH